MDYYEITERTGYLRGPVNIGVIKDNGNAILVDTGIDKDTAKDIVKALDGLGLTLAGIINTHHHADHIGGNAYLQKQSLVATYASSVEAALIEAPILEPIYLFSGANPPQQLRNKFVLAKPSKVDKVIQAGKIAFDKITVKIVPLPGHSPNQIGVAVDDILFCADAVFSLRVVEKYKLPFVQDVKILKETLEKLKTNNYSYYVPSHTRPRNEISELAELNLEAIQDIEDRLLSLLETPKSTEQAISMLCEASDLTLNKMQQYYLNHTLVTSYLGSLYDEGRIKISFKNNIINWARS